MSTWSNALPAFVKNSPSAICLAIFFLFFVIYNLNLAYETSGDIRGTELTPVSIINEGNLEFSEFSDGTPGQYWFYADPATQLVVSVYPIFTGILVTPVYWIAHILGIDITSLAHQKFLAKFCSAAIASLTVVLMYLLVLEVSTQRTAFLMAGLFGLGTDIWATASRGLWQHGPGVLFIILSLLFLLRGKKNKNYLPWVGLWMGCAVWTRPANVLLLLPLALYVLFRHRQYAAKFITLGALPVLMMCLYSWTYFHEIKNLGQAQVIEFSGNFFQGLVGLLISPSHGILTHAPVFIFAFASFYYAFQNRKKDPLYLLLVIGSLLFLFFIAKWPMWWGGWSYGYRLLIELSPFLMLLSAYWWHHVLRHNKIMASCFIVLALLSVGIETVGAFFSPCRYGNRTVTLEDQSGLWDITSHPLLSCINRASFCDPSKRLDVLFHWNSPYKTICRQ